MRIIAGAFRSRSLVAPRGLATRPTSDRLRETLFNVLGDRVPGARFLDLFAGSGAVGLEALSRGAAHCVFVEEARHAIGALRENVAALRVEAQVLVDGRPVARFLAAAVQRPAVPFDLVFLDPPYAEAEQYRATLSWMAEHPAPLLAPGALVVAEHARRDDLAAEYGALRRTRVLVQGDAALSFFAIREIREEASPGLADEDDDAGRRP